MSGNHCSHCPATDLTAIFSAVIALVLAAAAVWFVLENIVLVGLLLMAFAVTAGALVFVCWKYGAQLAGFRFLRAAPVRRQAVTARVVSSLSARAPAAIEAPKAIHPAFVLRNAAAITEEASRGQQA